MSTMTVSEARSVLPDLLRRIEQGEEVTITRHGRPAAVLIHPDLLRSRRIDNLQEDLERVQALLAPVHGKGNAEPAAGLSNARAEELVDQVRASREAR